MPSDAQHRPTASDDGSPDDGPDDGIATEGRPNEGAIDGGPDDGIATEGSPDDGVATDGGRHADVEAARHRARRREATLSRDLADIVASMADSNSDDEHDPEGATIAFERAQVTELLRTTRVELAALDAAAARIEAGTYGWCERCSRAIAPARLAARPSTTTCIDCA